MPIIAAAFVILFIIVLAKSIGQFIENENSPVVTEPAFVTRKVNDTHTDANGVSSTTLLIYFEIGDQPLKCAVSRRIYRAIPEGVSGHLTHQGTRFKAFEFHGQRIEK